SGAGMEFYPAACQVIPVLFVVMAFEAQVLTRRAVGLLR
ncbi:MAG: hypothetical protein K0S98_2454, partial [Propionibacteriaceae bacterium]|nr:hypothetical protein [Propionibacteriaceae bacterium]